MLQSLSRPDSFSSPLLYGPYPSRLGALAGLPKEITPASLETVCPRVLTPQEPCSPQRAGGRNKKEKTREKRRPHSIIGDRAGEPGDTQAQAGLTKIDSDFLLPPPGTGLILIADTAAGNFQNNLQLQPCPPQIRQLFPPPPYLSAPASSRPSSSIDNMDRRRGL
ncbi:hypothetical protein NQZ68_027696 [Dissostichus eleginoides]|nr:hypothetical protein NQZ68_027696 [Dissostichus eleginoides]